MDMKKLYFTLTGTKHYFGKDFIEKDMEVLLVKEPDNECDAEAIKVELEPFGKIGYVANNPYTVIGKCFSAGRLYDKIDDNVVAKVLYVTEQGIICVIEQE